MWGRGEQGLTLSNLDSQESRSCLGERLADLRKEEGLG